MIQTPDGKRLNGNLKPSRFSASGFVGNDTRPVEEIIRDDLQSLENMGITITSLVSSLKKAHSSAQAAFGAQVIIRGNITATYYESRGTILSPFRKDGRFPKGETRISDSTTGESIRVTSLGINLIERHGFFQGKGSPYRIEPFSAVRLLGL